MDHRLMLFVAFLVIVCIFSGFVRAKEPANGTVVALVFSPGYFKCAPCAKTDKLLDEIAAEYKAAGKSLIVKHLIIESEEEAQALGLTSFPTIIIGQKIVGYYPDAIRSAIRGVTP